MKKLNYQQLALKMITRIRNGEYPESGKLESIRELAAKYGVGRQVVASALQILAKSNYIYSVHGSGTYVNLHQESGLFHRIGIFISESNPLISTHPLGLLRDIAMKNGFNLILGSNFEEDFTLKEWYERHNNFDGIIITGKIQIPDLNYLKRHRIPYVVKGNYDIPEEHPRAEINLREVTARRYADFFRNHPWQKIAVVAGRPALRANREVIEGVLDAAAQNGLSCRILQDDADGFQALNSCFSKEIPDAVILVCDYWKGFQKYCQLNPDFKRPHVVVPAAIAMRIPGELYDYCVDTSSNDIEKELSEKSMTVLLQQIYNKKQKGTAK